MKKNYLFVIVGLFLFPSILIAQLSISGQITRHNGDSVPDIEVNCDGTVTTDVDGNFEFTDVPLNYSCDVTPNGVFDKFEGVTVLDALLMSQHILAINLVNPYQIFASDVNSSESVTSLDVLKVSELALRIDNSTPDIWKCIDADHTFGNPFVAPPFFISVVASDTVTDVDFIAIKAGDPAISSDFIPAPPTASSPVFTISDETFQVGDDVQFKVAVEDFSDIVGFQQTFNWDPSILEFQSIDGAAGVNVNVNDAEIAQGLLPTLSTLPITNMLQIQDGEVIMTLNFKVLADVSSPTEVLSFSDEITERQVVWQNPNDLDLFIVDGEYINGVGTFGNIPDVSISGQITRHNGDPVPGLEVNCDGTVTTDIDGNFEFTDVPLNYVCDVMASGTFDKYEEVTVLDALVLQQHILQLPNSISPYQILACDLNNSHSLTALDIVRIFQLALRQDDVLLQENWINVDAGFIFPVPFTFTPPTSISVTASDTITGVDFIAIKKGDPAISPDYMPAPPIAPLPIFTISNETFQIGDDVQFEVTVEDFSDVAGFQQTFKWDPNVLEFQSADGALGINVESNNAEIAQGLLPTLSMMNMVQIQDGEVIMTLNFKVLADVSSPTEVLSFSDEITARQVVWQNPNNANLFIVDAAYMNGEGTTGLVNAPEKLESFQVFPNPVEENINVKALLQSVEDFEISIVNVLGQQIYLENFSQKELLLNISFNEFPAGTYFLSLKTADGIQTESFVKK